VRERAHWGTESVQYSARLNRWIDWTIDLPVLLAIFIAGLVHFLVIIRIQSPLVVDDEFQYFVAGLSYNDIQWARYHTNVPEFGTHLYPFIISFLAKTASPVELLKLLHVSVFAMATAAFYFGLKNLGTSVAERVLFILFMGVLPTASYATYIMPDALYASVLWIIVVAFCVAIPPRHMSSYFGYVAFGAAIGILTLIKQQGVFVYLAAAAATALACMIRPTWREAIGSAISRVAMLSVGYALAALVLNSLTRPDGLAAWYNLVGGFYTQSLPTNFEMKGGASAAAWFFFQQYNAIMLLYAPTVASIVLCLVSVFRDASSDHPNTRGTRLLLTGLFIAFLLFGLMLMLSVLWSFDTRVRFRYLNFVFPAVVFVALALVVKRRVFSRASRLVMAAIWLAAAAGFHFTVHDRLLFLDTPELHFAYRQKLFGDLNLLSDYGTIVGVLCACAGAVLLNLTSLSPVVINLVVLIPLNLISLLGTYAAQRSYATMQDPYDKIGVIARHVCTPGWGKVAIVATPDFWAQYYHAMFNIRWPSIFVILNGKGEILPRSNMTADPALIGKIAAADCVLSHLELNDKIFARESSTGKMILYRIRPDARVLLRTPQDFLPREPSASPS
jgi:hypothetical protein